MRKLKYIKLFEYKDRETSFEPKEDLLFYFNGGSFEIDWRRETGELFIQFPGIDGKSESITKLRNGIDLITKYLNDEKPIVQLLQRDPVTGREECELYAPNKEVEFRINGYGGYLRLKKTGSSRYEVYVPTEFGFTGNKYIDVSVKDCIYKIREVVQDLYGHLIPK